MDKEKLDEKMAFLQTVAMPDQIAFTQGVKDYMKYRKTAVKSMEGCYAFLVRKGKEDSAEIGAKELKSRDVHLKDKLDAINKQKKGTIKTKVDEFSHIWIGKDLEQIECRLYLRIIQNNIHELAEKIIDECLKRNISLYFKFATGKRNDSFVFYTDYEHVQAIVDLIEEIYQKNPNLFLDADKLPPLWGKVGGFIGFMEEPQKEVLIYDTTLAKSANTYRTRLLDSIADDYERKGAEPQFLTTKNIGQFSLPLDISPRFFPLNNSSVEEMEKAGYNIGLIGTNPTDIFVATKNDTAGLNQ